MAQKTMNTEWCALKRPIIRFGYGDYSDRGMVETKLGLGESETRHSEFIGADYDLAFLGLWAGPNGKDTARIRISRKDWRTRKEEPRTVDLSNWTKPKTHEEASKDYNEAVAAYHRLLAHEPKTPLGNPKSLQRVVAIPFEGNGEYVVVARAEISVPSTVGKFFGKGPTLKLYVSEGILQEPLNYGRVGAAGSSSGGP